MRHVAVIGAGMAGAGAARALAAQGCRVTVLERSDRVGGRVRSERVDGTGFEVGAGFLSGFYTRARELVEESGHGGSVERLNGRPSVIRDGRPQDARSLKTLLGNGWLSQRAKLRVLLAATSVLANARRLDPAAMWRAHGLDTKSVTQLFAGGHGPEVLDYLAAPVIDGYLYWDPDRTSAAAFLCAVRAALTGGRQFAVRDGLQRLVEFAVKDAETLPGHEVHAVVPVANGRWRVDATTSGASWSAEFDAVVCATTATVVPEVVPQLGELRNFFARVSYTSTTVAVGGLRRAVSPVARSVAIPARESGELAAITFSPRHDEGAADEVVKIYASGRAADRFADLDDVAALTALRKEAARLGFGEHVTADAAFWRLYRWPQALPEFPVGHLRAVNAFLRPGVEPPGLAFAGDYLGGPFVEGALRSGQAAAGRLLTAHLARST